MKRVRRVMDTISQWPLIFIEGLVSFGLTLFALYALSPWYEHVSGSTVSSVFQTLLSRIVFGLAILVGGILGLYGIKKQSLRFRSYGTFWAFCTYSFLTILRLIIYGFTPFTWLWIMLLALISAVLHIRINWERK